MDSYSDENILKNEDYIIYKLKKQLADKEKEIKKYKYKYEMLYNTVGEIHKKLNYYITLDKKMVNFYDKYNFEGHNDLIVFVEKYKNHICEKQMKEIKNNEELNLLNLLDDNNIGEFTNVVEMDDNKKENLNNNISNEIIFEDCPIIVNNIEEYNIDWKKHVCNETFRIIESNKVLYDKIKKEKNIDINSLNKYLEYIIIKRDMKYIKSNKHYIKNVIKRSVYLYNKHNEELKYLTFSFNKMVRLNEEKWQNFLDCLKRKSNDIRKL